jgi:hypothetical protein
MASKLTSTPDDAALVEKLQPMLDQNGAVTVRLKNGAEYAGRIKDARVGAQPSAWDPEAWAYSGYASLVNENDVEVPLDVVDIAAIVDCPELDAAMAALWKSRGYPERPR